MIYRVVMEKMIVEVVVIVMKEELKGIAERMTRSGYEKECCQVLVLRKCRGLSVDVSGQIRQWYTGYLRLVWGETLLC
ncbi:hypothetical protein Hanom_Chr16g01463081 [Helianthus anomalus]